jgi:hypothetical protein
MEPVDPRFPWILIARFRNQTSLMRDTRTGEEVRVHGQQGIAEFIAAHSATQGHSGLGDIVRSVTKFFGFGACEPCAKRRAALNAAAPRVYRRR